MGDYRGPTGPCAHRPGAASPGWAVVRSADPQGLEVRPTLPGDMPQGWKDAPSRTRVATALSPSDRGLSLSMGSTGQS